MRQENRTVSVIFFNTYFFVAANQIHFYILCFNLFDCFLVIPSVWGDVKFSIQVGVLV